MKEVNLIILKFSKCFDNVSKLCVNIISLNIFHCKITNQKFYVSSHGIQILNKSFLAYFDTYISHIYQKHELCVNVITLFMVK